jgi:hypothetical protein
MDFTLITNILQEKNLSNPSLDVLIQDHNLYNTILYQPIEEVEATANYVRNVDRNQAEEKFESFFNIVTERNVELAVTPEYSCPWRVVCNLIENDQLPNENKLWIVGCESIRPNELREVIDQYRNVEWIYETDLLDDNIDSDNFFDPVCYFFKTRTSQGELRNVIIVQFKTHTMGGRIPIERNNMIMGNNIYILLNSNDSSRLFTLICSDALNINGPNLYDGFMNNPHLICHLQLNPSPCHSNIRPYRVNIFNENWPDKEVLCLNWSRNLTMNGGHFNDFGGTALYLKSENLDTSDAKIHANHTLGMYYTTWNEKYTTTYYLNYDSHVFHFRNTKPSQRAAPPPNQIPGRTGPEMVEVRKWDNDWVNVEEIEDGFCSLCEDIEQTDGVSLESFKSKDISPIDTERLITLCTGEIDGENWHSVKKMKFFKIEDNENIKRITFTHHPDQGIRLQRKGYLRRCAILDNVIIKNGANIPDNISDLKDNCTIKYRPNGYENRYNLNLFPKNDEAAPASVSYLSEEYDEEYALNLQEKMMDLFENDQFEKRIVVWLRNMQGGFNTYSSHKKPNLKDNPSRSKRSFKKTD